MACCEKVRLSSLSPLSWSPRGSLLVALPSGMLAFGATRRPAARGGRLRGLPFGRGGGGGGSGGGGGDGGDCFAADVLDAMRWRAEAGHGLDAERSC